MKKYEIMKGYKYIKMWVIPEDWRLFKSICAEQNMSMREVIGNFIKDYVGNLDKIND